MSRQACSSVAERVVSSADSAATRAAGGLHRTLHRYDVAFPGFPDRDPMPSPTAVRPAGPPRMSDVARLAGVSKMTVSRVLAGHSVAADTRARVCQAIDQLGYVADAAAGALSSGRSEFVAVLVPSLSSSNFSDTVRGLTDALEPHGLQLLLGDTDYDLEREERLPFDAASPAALRRADRCAAHRCDAQGAGTLGHSVVEMWDLPTHPIDTAVGFRTCAPHVRWCGTYRARLPPHRLSAAPANWIAVASTGSRDTRRKSRRCGWASRASCGSANRRSP